MTFTGLTRKIGTLSTMSLVAQACAMLVILFLKFKFDDTEFKNYILVVSVSLILSVLATLKLERAISLTRSKKRASVLLLASVASSIVISMLATVASVYWQLSQYFYIFYMLTLFSALIVILQTCCFYFDKSSSVGIGRLSQVFINGFFLLLLSITELSLFDALCSLTLAQGTHCFILFKKIFKNVRPYFFDLRRNGFRVMIIILWQQLFRHLEFVKYVAPEALIGVLLPNLPFFVVENNFSDKITADYGFMHRMIATPLSALAQSISSVIYPLYIRATPIEILKLFRSVLCVGALANIIIFSLLGFMLANNYLEFFDLLNSSQEIFFILLLYFGVVTVFNSMSGLHIYMGLKKASLYFTIFMTFAKVPIMMHQWTDIGLMLLACYGTDLCCVIILNIMCYKRILRKC